MLFNNTSATTRKNQRTRAQVPKSMFERFVPFSSWQCEQFVCRFYAAFALAFLVDDCYAVLHRRNAFFIIIIFVDFCFLLFLIFLSLCLYVFGRPLLLLLLLICQDRNANGAECFSLLLLLAMHVLVIFSFHDLCTRPEKLKYKNFIRTNSSVNARRVTATHAQHKERERERGGDYVMPIITVISIKISFFVFSFCPLE